MVDSPYQLVQDFSHQQYQLAVSFSLSQACYHKGRQFLYIFVEVQQMMSKLLASKERCRWKPVCKLNYRHGAFDGSEILRSPPGIYKTLKNNGR